MSLADMQKINDDIGAIILKMSSSIDMLIEEFRIHRETTDKKIDHIQRKLDSITAAIGLNEVMRKNVINEKMEGTRAYTKEIRCTLPLVFIYATWCEFKEQSDEFSMPIDYLKHIIDCVAPEYFLAQKN